MQRNNNKCDFEIYDEITETIILFNQFNFLSKRKNLNEKIL